MWGTDMAELILQWETATEAREARIEGDAPAIVGREAGSAVQIASQTISRKHARIARYPHGFTIADLTGGRNPVIVNGYMIGGETPLRAGDTLQLGDVTVYVAAVRDDPAPDRLTMHLRWTFDGTTHEETIGDDAPVVIGRDAGATLVIASPTVSRAHVRIAARDGRFILTDLTSGRNSVAVNQRPVERERALGAGDVIRLGTVTVIVTAVRRVGGNGAAQSVRGLVLCPSCLREVDGSLEDCPWCGTTLVNAYTVI